MVYISLIDGVEVGGQALKHLQVKRSTVNAFQTPQIHHRNAGLLVWEAIKHVQKEWGSPGFKFVCMSVYSISRLINIGTGLPDYGPGPVLSVLNSCLARQVELLTVGITWHHHLGFLRQGFATHMELHPTLCLKTLPLAQPFLKTPLTKLQNRTWTKHCKIHHLRGGERKPVVAACGRSNAYTKDNDSIHLHAAVHWKILPALASCRRAAFKLLNANIRSHYKK